MSSKEPINSVTMLGIPFDDNSSFLRGAAQAPRAIREALDSSSSNKWSENGMDIGRPGTIHDAGNVLFDRTGVGVLDAIEDSVRQNLQQGSPLLCLGGDHSITFPIIKAFHSVYPSLTILHFDAHPDLYDEFEGNRHSHACPFARIMESKLASRLIQVGIRTLNKHQKEQAEKWGVELICMRDLSRFQKLQFNSPLYVSFDLDVFDPAFAPGVSHYEPGGMSVREALSCLEILSVPLVGADIVEYNPTRDRNSQTALVCAKLLKELASRMLVQ